MNWDHVKSAKEVQLDGVTVEFDRRETRIAEVIVRDAKGGMLRITNDSWTLGVLQPAKPKTEKRFALVGTIAGMKTEEVFATRDLAAIRMQDVAAECRDCSFEIVEREVEVSE